MAKQQKVFKIEHRDSFVKDEISEEDWDKLQPRVQAKYRIIGDKTVAATPPEAQTN